MNSSEPSPLPVVRELLVQAGHIAEPAAVGPNSKIADLDLDSLDLLEFLMLVEERTGVEVDLEALTPAMTLADLCDLISARSA